MGNELRCLFLQTQPVAKSREVQCFFCRTPLPQELCIYNMQEMKETHIIFSNETIMWYICFAEKHYEYFNINALPQTDLPGLLSQYFFSIFFQF